MRSRQEQLHLVGIQVRLDLGDLIFRFGQDVGIFCLFIELKGHFNVRHTFFQGMNGRVGLLGQVQLADNFLSLFVIIPEIRRRHLMFVVGNICF